VDFLIVLAVLAVVVFVVTGPLRRQRAPERSATGGLHPGRKLAELEAARDAKYREIRDAELDHRTGKLSDADFDPLDRELRAEAIGILRALDGVRGTERPPGEDDTAGDAD
jgi:hypothetical protein